MFVQLLRFSAATAKSAITLPRRIGATTRIVLSLASFVRAARNILRIAKPNSYLAGVGFNLTPREGQ
jgi:hypothetical protein